MSDRNNLFDLKEKAKWSSDSEEKKTAIKELSTHGENAIFELQEIMNITAYDDIKSLCAEAIKSIQGSRKAEVDEKSSSDANSAGDDITTTKDQKKETFEKEAESGQETGVGLADMPP